MLLILWRSRLMSTSKISHQARAMLWIFGWWRGLLPDVWFVNTYTDVCSPKAMPFLLSQNPYWSNMVSIYKCLTFNKKFQTCTAQSGFWKSWKTCSLLSKSFCWWEFRRISNSALTFRPWFRSKFKWNLCSQSWFLASTISWEERLQSCRVSLTLVMSMLSLLKRSIRLRGQSRSSTVIHRSGSSAAKRRRRTKRKRTKTCVHQGCWSSGSHGIPWRSARQGSNQDCRSTRI